MANDREFIIQPLISDGRLLKLSDINPNTSYVQVGVWQPNQQASGSPGNSYPSYALPISEISAKSNKNIIVVDETYGDDTTALAAGNYDFNKPFATIDAAILVAQPKDTLWLMPGGTYFVTENLLEKALTIYAWSCLLIFQGAQTGKDSAILTIKGNADVFIYSGAGFNTTPCLYANIDIECNNFYAFDTVPFYLDHLDYSEPCYFTLKANHLYAYEQFFCFAALNYNINVDIVTYERFISNYPGFPYGDFYITNLGAGSNTGYNTTCRFNFGSTYINAMNGYSLIKLDYGAPENKYFVTGNIFAQNYSGIAVPTAIVHHDSLGGFAEGSFVEIDATINLIGVSAYVARGPRACEAIIKGTINHDANTIVDNQFSACYYVTAPAKIKLFADTICTDLYTMYLKNAGCIVDIMNCKIINNSNGGNCLYIYSGKVNINNSKFLLNPASTNTISAFTPATPINIYSLYNNLPADPVNITNAIAATGVLGEITSSLFTSDTNI